MCVRACVREGMHASVRMCMLCYELVFSYNCNLFKYFLSFCLMLNYQTFKFEFYSFTFYVDGMFQSKFPSKDNKVLLSYYLN